MFFVFSIRSHLKYSYGLFRICNISRSKRPKAHLILIFRYSCTFGIFLYLDASYFKTCYGTWFGHF